MPDQQGATNFPLMPSQNTLGDNGVMLGIERFGASAPYNEIYTHVGVTVDKIVETAAGLV